MVEPVTTTVAIVKGVCWLCSALGIGYCAKKAHDAYSKGQKTKQQRLALKGKSIEQAREENKKSQTEIDDWKKKHEENEEKIKELEKKIEDAKSKAIDPNLSEDERTTWKNRVAQYGDEIKNLRKNNGSILNTIKGLGDKMKLNSKIISGTLSNLDDRHWIWEFLTLENIMIMGAVYALYKILKEEKRDR